MFKALTGEEILWLTQVCQIAWKLGKTLRDWQTGVIIPIFKKGDRKQCTNYRRISLLSLPGNVYAKCLERKCREIVESKLEDGHCSFRPGRSTTDQIFTLKQMGVELRQGCVLSPLLFIVNMHWIDKCSQADECATIGNGKISRLLFANDLVIR